MLSKVKREDRGVEIRTMRREDSAEVSRILQQSPEAVSWAERSLEESADSATGVALVSESLGEITGFVLGRQIGNEAEILNLAILPEKRRRGEGRALLEKALAEFQTRGVRRVFLEVRESNVKAIAFYKKHGFSETGRRKAYYRDPEEAALLMEKQLNPCG